ncbi:chemotaxis protein [Paenibacillus sp. CAA11]|uniref:methyl-accepting chemotaxis protein n=1 Tax=Paenibacillus sp. CAA11 TaxID=1532905 RepID=UPI000D39975C|nr:methyl-accepting chemotaxis protein [Paenibacillus sp. CAA11]AWB43056.1 chemotaxis protein [Paenibacillus sp. CAA11]
MNTLDAVIAAMPVVEQLLQEDATVTIYDREKILYVLRNPSGLKPGAPLLERSRNFGDLKNGREKTVLYYPPEVFGLPLNSLQVPIMDEQNEVIGVINVTYNLENQQNLQRLMNQSEEIIGRLVDSVQHVAAHSEELNSTTDEMLHNTKRAVENSSNVTEVASFIREISEQTNLLGLNAAIEAARVGEAGAGFGVVAKEIRKMSVDTKEATTRIEDSLKSVKTSMHLMETELSEIAASSHEQALLVTSFMEAIEQLNTTNKELKEFVEKFIDLQE